MVRSSNRPLRYVIAKAWDVWPYRDRISSVMVNRMTIPSTKSDFTERIWKELTTSLDDAQCVQSIRVNEGWGDILYVTIRKDRPCLDHSSDLDDKLKSAVASALGEIRHIVKID